MADQDQFARLCERVCEEHGWDLLKSGVQVTFADDRHQLVELEFFHHRDEDLVRLFTTIGPVAALSQVRLTVALRINAELAHGCLAVKNDDLVMTDTLMMKDADFSELSASIGYLAETADYYEKTIYETDNY